MAPDYQKGIESVQEFLELPDYLDQQVRLVLIDVAF